MIANLSPENLLKENHQLRVEINNLKEELAWFRRQVFGKKSEKIIATINNEFQPELGLQFKELPTLNKEEEKKLVSTHERKKPNRDGKDKISLPENLPVERVIVDLPENEKKCPITGKDLVKIGEEVTRKIANKPSSYYIKEIVRLKYALPANSPESGVLIADLPEGLLNRCQADESFLADLLVKKYADHLPLYRIEEILDRQEIHVRRQILSKWVIRTAFALKPLFNEMTKHILKNKNIFIDEIPIPMLDPGKGKTHQAYMWVMVGGKESSDPVYRIYNFRTSRQHIHATNLLKDFNGILHSDKYGAYENLANTKQFTWCPCWVHIRRKFLEESGDPEFRSWILRKIRYLFMFERVAWSRTPEERLKIRLEKEIPLIDEMIKAVKEKLFYGNILPRSKFKEALGYFTSLIPHLKNYTLDPWSRADNNVAERAVRPLAIGRKNWMFMGNEEGGEAAGIIYSLIQTCRAIGVNPREYLEDVMRRLMNHNSQKLYELLPDHWAQAQKAN